MAQQDFYAVLGVSPTADADAIKKQYRRLAKQFHPDANKGDAKAAERFKEISEAYNVLGDAEKRREYDEMRRLGAFGPAMGRGARGAGGAGGARRGAGGPQPRMEDFDVSGVGGFGDLFGTIFGGGRSGRPQGAQRGSSIETTLEIPFKTAVLGGKMPVTLGMEDACSACGGSGAAVQGGGVQPCATCRGSGVERITKTLNLSVPAGTETGSRIRLTGQGGRGIRGGPPGDITITAQVRPDPDFTREGQDLVVLLPVNIAQAVLGSKVSVTTLDGKTVSITLPAGTSSGKRIRVRGQGIEKGGKRGDLYVEVRVTVPATLTTEERELFQRFVAKAGVPY